jgi:hypothetical protein
MLQPKARAQAVADSRPEQTDYEGNSQPKHHKSGNKGDDAGGMLHVVMQSVEPVCGVWRSDVTACAVLL